MAYIHCCSASHKARVFHLCAGEGFTSKKILLLEKCPVCLHTVLVFLRVDWEDNLSVIRKTNRKAALFFEKIKPDILFEEKRPIPISVPASNFYLKCNEYGRVTKCFSNLYSCQLGLFDPYEGLDAVSKKEMFLE